MSALEARARRIHERASAGEDFAKLAAEFSDASQRTNPGGQMGLRPAMRYPQLFVDAASGLRVGDISPVLRSDAGFHILKVIERRLAGMPNLNVAQTRARHILLRPGAQLSEEQARTQLTDFKRRLEAGQADFAALAKEHSQDGSAREGGDLGWTGPGTFVPEFEEVLAALSPSQIAEPLVSRFGVHLIQLIDRRTTTLTDREQREAVRNLVREKKLEEAYTNWAQEVRGRAYVEMREPPA